MKIFKRRATFIAGATSITESRLPKTKSRLLTHFVCWVETFEHKGIKPLTFRLLISTIKPAYLLISLHLYQQSGPTHYCLINTRFLLLAATVKKLYILTYPSTMYYTPLFRRHLSKNLSWHVVY